MRKLVESIENEFQRYREIGAGVLGQLSDEELGWRSGVGQNSVEILVCHISGNLRSRFTEFLTSDGEKPGRDRESEFAPDELDRAELSARWDMGWETLFGSLSDLSDDHLLSCVRIRGQELTVHHALCRSLAHVSYHVGQMVMIGRQIRGPGWKFLSIPPGGSAEYNRNPTRERGPSPDS